MSTSEVFTGKKSDRASFPRCFRLSGRRFAALDWGILAGEVSEEGLMTTDVISAKREEIRTQVKDYPAASARFDWLAVALSAWVIGGAYLDGWAHNHGRVDDVFFT